MNKLYNKITFENDNVPALNESNLNSISKAIDDIDDRLIDVAGLIEGSISMSYTDLTDKPSINGVTLEGNKTSADLNISANVKYGTSAEFEAYKQDDSVPVGTEYIVTDDYESGESSSKYDYDLITTGTLVETHPSLSNQKKVNEFIDGMVDLNKNNIGTLSQLSTSNKDNLVGAINEVFQDVSDGKELIADAITDKGITTSATDTFQTMATNIGNISGGTELIIVGKYDGRVGASKYIPFTTIVTQTTDNLNLFNEYSIVASKDCNVNIKTCMTSSSSSITVTIYKVDLEGTETSIGSKTWGASAGYYTTSTTLQSGESLKFYRGSGSSNLEIDYVLVEIV